MSSAALISPCGVYRYALERRWSSAPPMVFCMLNPSTADAEVDDPTIRRCKSFAEREGCGGIYVVNLFAFRATNPAELKAAADPVGPKNVQAIGEALLLSAVMRGPFVAAWGAHPSAGKEAARLVERTRSFSNFGLRIHCLGKTQTGAPKHPLYLRADAPLEVWP